MLKALSLRIFSVFLFLVSSLFIFQVSASAETVLVRESNSGSFGYGNADWSSFTATMNSIVGAENITVVADFDASVLTDYDAVWIDLGDFGDTLSSEELEKLEEFVATGKKLVMIGENDFWTVWDNSLLSLVGSEFDGEFLSDDPQEPTYSHPLTSEVSSIRVPAAGTAEGGLSLFDSHFATLWGDDLNIFVLLDVNIFDDDFWVQYDNAQFGENTIRWLVNAIIEEEESSEPSTPDAPTCTDGAPSSAPDLFQINTTSSEAILYFVPVGNSEKYFIRYGFTPSVSLFGTEFSMSSHDGVISYAIGSLAPNTNYYFSVRGGHGCMPGAWSNTLRARTTGAGTAIFYK
jgi:hypothetical protein